MSNNPYQDILQKPTLQFNGKWPIKNTAQKVFNLVNELIVNSSTRESLKSDGYPSSGEIETTIRSYQKSNSSPYQQALMAMETHCGNCQEMAYLGALLLRYGGYEGEVHIGQFGINHAFLIIGDIEAGSDKAYIVDVWAGTCFPYSSWKENLKAYGGRDRDGIMKGWLLDSTHFDLEDEVPESVASVGSLKDILPNLNDVQQLHSELCKLLATEKKFTSTAEDVNEDKQNVQP